MSGVTCLLFHGREYYVVNDRYISADCVCNACESCSFFLDCIRGDLNAVLCETGYVSVIYNQGCAGNCKGCFFLKQETDNYYDDYGY